MVAVRAAGVTVVGDRVTTIEARQHVRAVANWG